MPQRARRTVLPLSDSANRAIEVKYKGVRKNRWGRYTAEIYDQIRKKNAWLGTFDTAVEAAHAYDIAARDLRGDKAKLNFPISAELNFPILEELDNNYNSSVRSPSQGNTLEFSSSPSLDLTIATDDSTIVGSLVAAADANVKVVFPTTRPLEFCDAFLLAPSPSSVGNEWVRDPKVIDLDLNAPPPSENS